MTRPDPMITRLNDRSSRFVSQRVLVELGRPILADPPYAQHSALPIVLKSLDAHGDVLETIRLGKPEQARARMSALIDIASADLITATANAAHRGIRSCARKLPWS